MSEPAMGTILRLVRRHLLLMASRHPQQLASGREVATGHPTDIRIFAKDAANPGREMPRANDRSQLQAGPSEFDERGSSWICGQSVQSRW